MLAGDKHSLEKLSGEHIFSEERTGEKLIIGADVSEDSNSEEACSGKSSGLERYEESENVLEEPACYDEVTADRKHQGIDESNRVSFKVCKRVSCHKRENCNTYGEVADGEMSDVHCRSKTTGQIENACEKCFNELNNGNEEAERSTLESCDPICKQTRHRKGFVKSASEEHKERADCCNTHYANNYGNKNVDQKFMPTERILSYTGRIRRLHL